MKKEVVNCLTWMMNHVAEVDQYNWSDEYRIKKLKESAGILYNELKKHIDVTKLTKKQAKELRFQRWSDEQPDLYLFPLWIVPLIPEGIEVYDIEATEPHVYQKDTADNDIRFGCVSYGIMIKE